MTEKKTDKLKEYRAKRDFDRTAEPFGAASQKGKKEPIFVIHKHDASNLHYDFRLEIDGVLKSWAVPKGPSTDPGEKRLAVETEDHPLEYADFEGVIPENEYGGGTVMIWDAGTFENLKAGDNSKESLSLSESYAKGKLSINLKGHKLKGGYTLINTKRGGKDQWLLIKMKDDHADARRNPASTEPDSVKSGRSLDKIRKDAAKDD